MVQVPPEAKAGRDAPQSREEGEGLDGYAQRRAESEEQQQPGVIANGMEIEAGRHVGNEQQDGDDDEVVQDRRRHRQHELVTGVEDRGHQRRHAVEEDLGCEHPQQRGRHRLLVAAGRPLEPEAVQVDDGGGDDDEQQRHPDEQQHGGRDDHRDGLPRLVLVASRQVLDEHRDDE